MAKNFDKLTEEKLTDALYECMVKGNSIKDISKLLFEYLNAEEGDEDHWLFKNIVKEARGQ